MAEPARQLPEDNKPASQPWLRSVSGGGQTTPSSGNSSASHLPEEDKAVSKPNLRALEGGGQGDGKPAGKLHSVSGGDAKSGGSAAPEDLEAAEASSGSAANSEAGGNFTANFGGGYGFYKGKGQQNEATGRLKGIFWGTGSRKKKTIAGATIGLLVGGGFLGLSILSGPFQFIELSQLLQHNFTKSQSDSESRTTNLLRDFKAIKAGDYRYTRVGLIGAKIMAKVVGQFEDAGVKFTGSDVLGRPTGIEVDRSIIEKNFPDTIGMSDEDFANWLDGKFDVASTGTDLKFTPGDNTLNIEGLKAQSIRTFINNTGTELLGDNAAVSAVKTRTLKTFFGLGSLFHPFSQAIQNKIAAKAAEIEKQKANESASAAEEEAASDVEDSNYADSVSAIEAPGVESFNTAKGQADSLSSKIGSKLVPGLGLLWATGCTLKGVSGAIVSMNRYLTVLPAAVEATSLISQGSQVQNGGSDISLNQLGATETGFTNSAGQSIWNGAALQATEGAETADALPKNSNGQIENDLPGQYKQAFGTDTTASNLNTAGDVLLSWFPPVPGGACSLAGIITITVGGALIQIGLAVIMAPDGETGDVAVQAAAQAGENVVIQTVQGKFLGPVIDGVVKGIAKATAAPALVRSSFSGALGGNLIAYGARAASNSSSLLNGGLSLANKTSTIIGSVGQEQQQQFRSESMFAKIFNIDDYRSLIGRLAMDIGSRSFSANLFSGISAITNMGSTLASVFSNFIPGVSAASNTNSWTGSYDWGFPQYGIPDNMLNDPALSDPYQNSETVGQYLSSVCTDGNGNIGPTYGACAGSVPTDSNDPGGGYTDRIKQCFGNTLTYSEDPDTNTSVWDVDHTATATSSDVNPSSDTYLNANCSGICPDTIADCGNTNEEDWEKIVMFVNDANNIKSLDCLAGYTDTSDQSCTDVGF